MRTACWITEATDPHSEYVIFIAFSTVTIVALTRLDIKLCVNFLAFSLYFREILIYDEGYVTKK